MGVLNSSRKAMKGFIEKSYSMGQLHGEMKKINDPRRQNLIETVHLTKAEENKIDTLFVSTYGKKIKYDWHRLYQSFTGKFDENYFPEYLFSSVLEPKMNPMDYRYVLDDKLLLPLFCVGVEHVRTPRTYYSVCDGICFDEEKNIVDVSRVYAAGYSAGGETMSQAVSMRPDLYAAYLHGASQWDGDYAPIAENGTAVYIFMAEHDEYYGSQRAWSAYNSLHDAYEEAGWSEEQISNVLQIQTPNDEWFAQRGVTSNYHGGGNVVFGEDNVLNWVLSHTKEENES